MVQAIIDHKRKQKLTEAEAYAKKVEAARKAADELKTGIGFGRKSPPKGLKGLNDDNFF